MPRNREYLTTTMKCIQYSTAEVSSASVCVVKPYSSSDNYVVELSICELIVEPESTPKRFLDR